MDNECLNDLAIWEDWERSQLALIIEVWEEFTRVVTEAGNAIARALVPVFRNIVTIASEYIETLEAFHEKRQRDRLFWRLSDHLPDWTWPGLAWWMSSHWPKRWLPEMTWPGGLFDKVDE